MGTPGCGQRGADIALVCDDSRLVTVPVRTKPGVFALGPARQHRAVDAVRVRMRYTRR